MSQFTPRAETSRFSRFGVLRATQFRRWWIGYVISISGQQMMWMAEGWLIYELSGSKLLLGLHGLAQAIPSMALSLLGGAIADRVDQRRLLIALQPLQMLVVGVMAALGFAQVLVAWHVIAGGFALSAIGAFEQPARESMFPHLIERRYMSQAVGLNAMVHPGTRVLAPVMAGFLLAWVIETTASAMTAGGVIFVVAGVGFAVYAVFLYRVDLPRIERVSRGNLLENVGQGLRFTWQNRIFALLLGAMYWNTGFALAISVLFPVIAKDILGLGPSGLGYLWMAQGIGSLMGAAWAASHGGAHGQGRYIVGGSIVLGFAVVGVGLSTWVPLTFFLLWVTGMGGSSASVGIRTAIQLMVPDDYRGRVMSLWGMTHTVVRPLGEMQFGALAAVMSAPFALALGGAAVLVFVFLVVLPNREIRTLRVRM